MKICVCGWYYDPGFMGELEKIHPKYSIFIVAHRLPVSPTSIPIKGIPNLGLEWGAYDHYLQKIWDGESDVLFTHDDNQILDPSAWNRIASIKADCSFIFRSHWEFKSNDEGHGRMVFMSSRFLSWIKNYKCNCAFMNNSDKFHQGFWFDQHNDGNLNGDIKIGRFSGNAAIQHFKNILNWVKRNNPGNQNFLIEPTYIPEIDFGYRGNVGLAGLYKQVVNLVG